MLSFSNSQAGGGRFCYGRPVTLEAKCRGLGTRTFRDSAIESRQRKQEQISYAEGDVQSTAVEVILCSGCPSGGNSWCDVRLWGPPALLTSPQRERERALLGFSDPAPGSNCSQGPYQKAFSPFFRERSWLLLSAQAVLQGYISW